MPRQTETHKRNCQCHHCKLSAEIRAVKKSRDFRKAVRTIDHLANELVQAEEDNNYYRAILDGSWLSSVEILARALANAKHIAKDYKKEGYL